MPKWWNGKDTLALGASIRNGVWVRLPPWVQVIVTLRDTSQIGKATSPRNW